MKVLNWLDKRLEESVLFVLAIFIACAMMFQLIMRYVFNSALPWPEELARYSLVIFCFFTVPYCIRRNLSLRIDMLVSWLPSNFRFVLDIVIYCIQIFTLLFLSKANYQVFLDAYNNNSRSPATSMPLSIIYGLCLFALILGCIRSVQMIILEIKNFRNKENKEGQV